MTKQELKFYPDTFYENDKIEKVIEVNYTTLADKIHVNDHPYEECKKFKTKEEARKYTENYNKVSKKLLGVELPFLILSDNWVYVHRWCVIKDGKLKEPMFSYSWLEVSQEVDKLG